MSRKNHRKIIIKELKEIIIVDGKKNKNKNQWINNFAK